MNKCELIVSGYASGKDEGVCSVSFDPTTNTFGAAKLCVAASNPSIGLYNNGLWYFVAETPAGKIHIYDAANWQHLAQIDAAGASPCHLAISKDNGYLAVANYMGGNAAVWQLDAAGIPQQPPVVMQHYGSGATPRQEAPHAHYVAFIKHQQQLYLYVVDLGIDQIIRYCLTAEGAWGEGEVVLQAQPGDGPRHFAAHPSNGKIYLLNELSNILSVHTQGADGTWSTQQRISTLPQDFSGENISAHIAISQNGQFIYTSNRGHHSIAVFRILPDGQVELIQIVDCAGIWPRYFTLLDEINRLIVAHEHSNSLAAFAIAADGCLRDTGARGAVLKPTFVGVK